MAINPWDICAAIGESTEELKWLEDAYREILHAAQERDQKWRVQAAARFGGVVRRYRHTLILALTSAVCAGRDVSRWGVLQWQRETFGRSVSWAALRPYGIAERRGGGRATNSFGHVDSAQCAEAFEHWSHAAPERAKLAARRGG